MLKIKSWCSGRRNRAMDNERRKKPELVAPAGDWSSLYSASEAGADAVYFGVKGLNMRASARNFDILEIRKVMDFLRGEGRKGYLALNVLVYDREMDLARKILDAAREAGVDAVIVWDMAALSIAKELGLCAHLSTQASVANLPALKAYSSLGVDRVVLARECALKDIENMIQGLSREKIKCRIETFIHGAMCVSVSGRCFLSHHSFFRSANRGDCIQPCRREFTIIDKDKECGYVLGEDYVLSAKDLCTVGFIDKLIEAGIHAFKIEGRMRPPEYVSVVTSVYRDAIDSFFEGGFDDDKKEELLKRLGRSFNRGFTSGFYFGRPDDTGGRVSREYEKVYLGEVVKFYKKVGVAEIMVRGEALNTGQEILVTGKKTPASFARVTEMQIEHEAVESAEKGQAVGVKLPFAVRRDDKVFLWKQEGAK